MIAPGTIRLASAPNLRDLGGHRTRDGGRVRRGQVYRSDDLTRLTAPELEAFARLGVRTVYDLRTEIECVRRPDRLPPGTRHLVIDVLRDSPQSGPAQLGDAFGDPASARAVLGGGRAERFFVDAYREFVTLPSARAGFAELFDDLARDEARPALFHCATGKDRTGWAAAALLLLLGVPEKAVMEEYMRSDAALAATRDAYLAQFVSIGGDPELLRPLMIVHPTYLRSALDEMRGRYGTIERYFSDGLLFDEDRQHALQEALVERVG